MRDLGILVDRDDEGYLLQLFTKPVEDRPTSEGPTRVGSTFEMDMKEGRKIVTYKREVTKYEPPRLMGVKLVGGCGKKPMAMGVDYDLTDLGGGRTRLDYSCRCEVPRSFVFKLMAPLFKLMGRSMIKKFMRNLRGLVEQPGQQAAMG